MIAGNEFHVGGIKRVGLGPSYCTVKAMLLSWISVIECFPASRVWIDDALKYVNASFRMDDASGHKYNSPNVSHNVHWLIKVILQFRQQ